MRINATPTISLYPPTLPIHGPYEVPYAVIDPAKTEAEAEAKTTGKWRPMVSSSGLASSTLLLTILQARFSRIRHLVDSSVNPGSHGL